jgi:hypothetical protein
LNLISNQPELLLQSAWEGFAPATYVYKARIATGSVKKSAIAWALRT